MRRLTRRQRMSAIVLAVVAVCFITLDLGGGALRNAHSGVRGTLGALYRGTDSVLGPVRRFLQGVPSAGSNQSKIDKLRAENAALRAQVAGLQADRRTSDALSQLERAAANNGQRLLPARVSALGPGQGFDWTITLDVGRSSGVRTAQTVTDGNGLVGRVLHADDDSSVVLLAADPGSGVGVRDVRTGELGLATGDGATGFTFAPLRPGAKITVGDDLITGPTDATSYVPGIAVGTVSSVRTSTDGTTRATVRPAAAPTALDIVAVVLGSGATSGGSGLADRAPR